MFQWLAAILFALIPAAALAQNPAPPPTGGNLPATPANILSNPNDFPIPTMPWNPSTRPELHGHVIGYVEVPSQTVTVELPVPDQAESAPFRLEPQVVTIPGYWVAETTTGYWYPQRWTLQQLNVGVYQWALLPAEFRRK
jgi:hypothetical protein